MPAESDRLTPEQQCAAAIDQLLARHKWQLLPRDEFVRQTLKHLHEGRASTAIRTALYTYSLALHTACAGNEGIERRNLGYTALFQYLYDSAVWRYPDISEEAAQRALAQVFLRFERCRKPAAFLAFASQCLLDAVRKLRRQASDVPLSESVPDQQANPESYLIAEELRQRFEQLTAEFLRRYPRSTQQIDALRLKFIDGLDEPAISRRLGKPIPSVYVLRSRAIEKLRVEPEWRALASELGILREE